MTLAAARAGDVSPGEIPSLDQLLEYEELFLRKGESREAPDSDGRFGGDPFRILYLADRQQYLVLLRNRSEILLADRSLNVLDRQSTPRLPAGWTLAHGDFLFVSGELTSDIYLYQITAKKIRLRSKLPLKDIVSVTDLVYVPFLQSLFGLDGYDRRLHQWILESNWSRQKKALFRQKSFPLGAGPSRIRFVDGHLLVNLLLEHSILIVPLKSDGPDFNRASRITHDGPIWSFDAVVWKDDLLIAAGGIENRPLNRSGGEFGYIDSFLFLYRVPRERSNGIYRWQPHYRNQSGRFTQWNLSEIDVVTPKAIHFAPPSKRSVDIWVSAFGSSRTARFRVGQNQLQFIEDFNTPPGTTDFVFLQQKDKAPNETSDQTTLVLTNSLFDRVYRLAGGSWSAVRGISSYAPQLSRESRTGEVLFFTTLMAPANRSEGELSRFTCEACHYEGTIDGRVHYTGREHVFAATKPLRGLANNVPLFSRAGDRSLSSMVLAEFVVANQRREERFSVEVSRYPWLKEIEGIPSVLSPTELRIALLSFFVDFEHRPNPLRLRGQKLNRRALRGLEVFRDRCEYCHQASISTRAAESLPFDEWRAWLESAWNDLVWAAPFYSKTGIEPYVHRAGARVPSLRRVWQKYPYFTNGSSRTLRDVLARFRYRDVTAWHHLDPVSSGRAAGTVKSLTDGEIGSLLELLRFF